MPDRFRSFVLLSTLVLISSFSGFAQTTTARLAGVVSDETGAVLPGTQVTVTNLATGTSRTTTTDDKGRYGVPELSPGSYRIAATLTGFETLVREGITLEVGQDAALNFTMKVGTVSEQVTVTGEAPLLDTTSGSVSGVVEQGLVEELPLNGRDFSKLPLVEPAVILARNTDTAATKGEGTRISIAGSRVDETAWLLDGANIKSTLSNFGVPGSAAGVILGVDSIREFRVLTSNYSAEYGWTSGGVVNMVTKGGTNKIHGTLFEYFRNSILDARNFFDVAKAPLRRNQFGGSVGGPVKKDKLFFFANYEELRQSLGVTNIATVPTSGVHQGQVPSASGTIQQVSIAPEIQPFMSLYPLPNGPVLPGGIGELISPTSQPTAEHFLVTRGDYQISDKQSLFARFALDKANSISPDTLPITSTQLLTSTRYATLQHDLIVTPQLLLATRLSYNRIILDSNEALDITFPAGTYVVTPELPSNVTVPGWTGVGANFANIVFNTENQYQFGESVLYSRGNHSIKTGFAFEKVGMNTNGGDRAFGSLGWGSVTAFLQDQMMNALMVGVPGSSAIRSLRQEFFGSYFQDDWKVLPHLNVNLGVRYEPFTVPTEKWDRLCTITNWATATQFQCNIPFFNNPSLKNFSPRVGFAWDATGDGKTAVRGGFGIFFVPIDGAYYRVQSYRNPPAYALLQTPLGNLASLPADIARVGPTVLTAQTNSQTFFQVPQYNLNPSYEEKFNLSVERQLPGNLSLSAGYIGGRGIHLWLVTSGNAAPPIILDGRPFIPAGTPRPNPNLTTGAINYSEAQSYYNALQAVLKKRFSRNLQFQASYTWSKNMDDSTTTAVASDYLEGDASQPYNARADLGLSALDVPQNFVVNGVYSLPSPAKSRLLSALLGGWQTSDIFTAASGLPLNPLVTGSNAPDLARTTGRQRPDAILGRSNGNIVGGTTAGCAGVPAGQALGTPNLYFDPCAFVLPPVGFYGDLGRNTLLGPGLLDFDFSLDKNTQLHFSETSRLEFRADFFNIFNQANFGKPAVNVLNATNRQPVAGAGLITSTSTTSRQLQFSLKLYF